MNVGIQSFKVSGASLAPRHRTPGRRPYLFAVLALFLINSPSAEAGQSSKQDERRLAAEASFAKAEELLNAGDTKQALAYYQQALHHYRRNRDPRGECATLNKITLINAILGNVAAARETSDRATKLAQSSGDRSLKAQALSNIGEIHYLSGELQQSVDWYRGALQLWIETGDSRGQAETYTSLGYAASDLGQIKDAFDFYHQALNLWKAMGDRQGEAVTLTAMGRLYSRVGESQSALDFFNRALPVIERSGNRVEQARVLTGIAFVYTRVGENDKAIDYYQRALSLFETANYLNGQASTLHSLAKVYNELDQREKALDTLQKGLEIARSIRDRRLEIHCLLETGKLLDKAGNKNAAIKNYLLARSFAHSQKDRRPEMDAWNLLGLTYKTQNKPRLALDCFRKALALSRKAEYRFGESAMLYHIARTQFELGELADAQVQTKAAIDVIESLRTKVGSYELRASYFASVRDLYELYIDVLMELNNQHPNEGFNVLAFEASERARARSLQEMLATARVGVREKVDPELLARERALREELSAKAEQSLLVQASSGREGERAAVDRELEDLATRYQEVRAQVRAASLDHTEQTQPRSLGLQEIRDRDLADDTALLEFFLGQRRSYLWVVTKNSFKSLSLPPRGEIEASAVALRKLLIPPTAQPGESFDELQARVREAESEYWRKASVFSETLLGPVAGDLKAKRLLIVPDGPLQYISFAALPIPARGDDVKPLMLEHEISLQPSASILAMLRSRADNPAEKAIAVFADPVFELDDSRFENGPRQMLAANPTHDASMERALRDVNTTWVTGGIPRLLASREEAEAITGLTSLSANLKAIGFEANKAALTSLDLSQFQIIHIATHGVLDSRRPELSGLLLSRFDKEGRPKEGFLRLDDIYNLSLSASMVVLSACNTGLGKDVRGEGLVGLVHGFMYAGTSRVVASLWKVDDDATAQLMAHFYREMFQGGKSPAAALRAAQIEMWEQKRWRSPYFWAAFVLHGDYEGRVNDTRRPQQFPWSAAAIAALLVAAGFFFWQKKLRKKKHAY